jgi:hypothetical protein
MPSRAVPLGPLLLAAACSGGAADAAPPAADREDLCPGQLTLEAQVTDLVTGQNAFDVLLVEADDDMNAATSAPNGRAILCLPSGTDNLVRSSKADHLPRLDLVHREAQAVWYGSVQPYPLAVVSEASLEELFADLELTRDEEAAQVLVAVNSYPSGQPFLGAVVEIDRDHDRSFTREADGSFLNSKSILEGGLLLFANTATTGGQVAVTMSLPEDTGGTCAGPASVPVEPGSITGVLFACR